MSKAIDLFYIDDRYYTQSQGRMSSLYSPSKVRYDWGLVRSYLEQGVTVTIRPATEEETDWATAELIRILKALEIEQYE